MVTALLFLLPLPYMLANFKSFHIPRGTLTAVTDKKVSVPSEIWLTSSPSVSDMLATPKVAEYKPQTRANGRPSMNLCGCRMAQAIFSLKAPVNDF